MKVRLKPDMTYYVEMALVSRGCGIDDDGGHGVGAGPQRGFRNERAEHLDITLTIRLGDGGHDSH